MKLFSLILAAIFGICTMVNAIAQEDAPMSAAEEKAMLAEGWAVLRSKKRAARKAGEDAGGLFPESTYR